MIVVKDIETLKGVLFRFDPMLVEIVCWIEEKYQETIITCGYRIGDEGVHGTDPCRGIDLRSFIFLFPEKVVASVNERWIYDTSRPEMKCAVLHDTGSGDHIHLQTHPNTKRRER